MRRSVVLVAMVAGVFATLSMFSSAATYTLYYVGQAGAGETMSFSVSGSQVLNFTFVNACPGNASGTPVGASMKLVNGRFSYHTPEFTITGQVFGKHSASGTERDLTGDCDSGVMSWTARLVSGTVAPSPAQRAGVLRATGEPRSAGSCLEVELAASNENYARVLISTAKDCLKWEANGVSILRRGSGGSWRGVFAASAYRCPVARIPRSVQRDLRVCPESQ